MPALPPKADHVPAVQPDDEGKRGTDDHGVMDAAKGGPVLTCPDEDGEEEAAGSEGGGDERQSEPADYGWGDGEVTCKINELLLTKCEQKEEWDKEEDPIEHARNAYKPVRKSGKVSMLAEPAPPRHYPGRGLQALGDQ